MVATSLYREIAECRLCRSRDLTDVMSLGEQSLSGCFPQAGEPDPPRAPLTLVHCAECGLIQLRHAVAREMMFTEHYGYRSGINETMRGHLAGIAHQVTTLVALSERDVVLDIGCNDGTLLAQFPKAPVRVGIDPLVEKFRDRYPDGIVAVPEFFTAETFRTVMPGRTAKAITSIAMFYDLEDPNAFVADIAAILDFDGVWVLEQSYMPTMLANNSYDTICHEHQEYYALAQIERLVAAHGLRVFDCETNTINGGSFRIFVCKAQSPRPGNDQALNRLRRGEAELGIDSIATFRRFRDRCEQLRSELYGFVSGEVARGRVFHLYGASTKGNTILQYCQLDHRLIAAAADRNPEKWRARTPATNIPIISEAESRRAAPDYFLVLPWHFREEFVVREAEFLAAGGKLVFPLPRLDIV